ncbi:ImmA/IrrE family metallo-endopeptidase [Abyssibius alkaniclasticus]|uniref:ImmA/IrrE family metallo-endopeptidase n=1 Tax=Abyssibius alkaniclasticus TaxID=2881234 RepID=UPI004058F4AF
MAVIDPVVNGRVADFIRGAVQSIFDSRFDWTPDAESILVLMREGGMTPEQERRFRPYFDLFVEQARQGEVSGFSPRVDDETFVDYPPKFDLDALLTPPSSPDAQKDLFDGTGPRTESERALIDQLIAATKLYDSSEAIQELFAFTVRLREFVYQLAYNRNHAAPTRFVTVAHELAHLYLGHLGADNGRRVPDRRDTPHALMEVEAEMAAYLVGMRNGLTPRSESYLSNYKGAFEGLNLYAVTRTANAVETAMGISAQKLWNEKA